MKAIKQLVNGIFVYTRHSADCQYKADVTYMKCGCPKWLQHQLGGKQFRESAKTRSFSQAKIAAERKAKELSGEATAITPDRTTVEQVVERWLAHRSQEGTGNKKAKYMASLLLNFCREHSIVFMATITRGHLNAFKLTLPYRSGDSNSLRMHLSVIGGLFKWAVEEDGCLASNPMPKFKLKFAQREVVPPTPAEVERVLAIQSVRPFASLMRYSGMAIQDSATLKRSALVGNLITGRRIKTKNPFRVRIPVWLAEELRMLPPVNAEYFFWDGEIQSESIAETFRLKLRAAFKEAKVKMTPHSFRHFFITQTLATGVSVEDVSHMVGTSPNEIRKTYRHFVKEATDRLDDVQVQAWLKQGLDKDGNPQGRKKVAVQ